MFADPVKILKQLGITDGMIVADLGAGSGFYAIPAAELASPGKVYAIEIQKDFLITIKNKAGDEDVDNLKIILGDVEKVGGTKLKDELVDRVIASNILFQIENKRNFVIEAFRILKKGGKMLFIDWAADSYLMPKMKLLIPKEKVRELFEQNGFVFERDVDAGEHHYGMILKKQ